MNDLNTLMHARVDDERPDLDRLLGGAIHDGRRIRRRRTIGYAGAGLVAGVVAGATVGAVTLFGGPHATDLMPAGQRHDVAMHGPTPSAIALDVSPVGQPKLVHVPSDGATPGGLTEAKGLTHGQRSEPVPFAIRLHGWSCGPAMDEKLICTGPRGQSAQITWRPASGYHEWITDPDKGKAAAAVTTKPHGRYFASLTGDSSTVLHDLVTLSHTLVWK